jgi:hypothetical protein
MARKAVAPSRRPRQEPPAEGLSAILRSLVRDLFDPYRPELHYMRGPGPKWRAKHAPAPASAPMSAPGMREAAV